MAKVIGQPKAEQKRVLIGTPALDGRVDAWYSFALLEIGKLAAKNNIDVQIMLLSYESILPMARNEIFTVAIEQQVDSLVFIDSDVYCDPKAFLDVVKSDKDVAAIPTVKKSDEETYDIYVDGSLEQEKDWLRVDRVSTSCLKLSKKVLQALANNSTQAIFRGKKLHNVCQYDFFGEAFIGEDIYLCEKIKALGFDIWVNTTSTCMHIGPKVYKGDFKKLLDNVNQTS